MPEPSSPSPARLTWLDRIFLLFSDIRPGEAANTLILAVNVFLLLASYYLLKTIREALILGESGAEIKSYSAAGQALLLLLFIPLYGMLGSKVRRMRLILIANGFFIACLVLFYVLGKAGVREGIAYYLWLGIYNNFVVAQFWAFANDIHSEEEGKRLFPVIGIGMSLGAWVGAAAVGDLIKHVGLYEVMLIGAAMLGICTALTFWSNSRAIARDSRQQQVAAQKLSSEGGFQLIFSQRYLLLVALVIFLLNVANSLGGYMLDKLATSQADALQLDAAARKEFIGVFFGGFFSAVNLLGFLIQSFVTSRIFKFIGVRGAMFLLPVIAFGAYGLLLVYPVLAVVRSAKILENATDYSVMNTVCHALYLLTSREAKYKAKAAIDTFVVRAGDMTQALLVLAGTQAALSVQGFAAMNLVVVVLWLAVTGLLFREHQKLEAAARERGEIA
jgi:ATP:ADP antiporter, AAA family